MCKHVLCKYARADIFQLHLLLISVCVFASVPCVSPHNVPVKPALTVLYLNYFFVQRQLLGGARRLRVNNFGSLAQFMCDCSTIWNRPIYSRLPPPPLPPCSLKVTPGDSGRGVLELLCQCETLQWQVCWWAWWLESRCTVPSSQSTHLLSVHPLHAPCGSVTQCMYAPRLTRPQLHTAQ